MGKIDELKDSIKKILPAEAGLSKIELEGPEITIYTKKPEAFFENEALVAKIASELKKRVNIRVDKTMLKDPLEAREIILNIIPKEADVKDIKFSDYFGEVLIEAIKPGLVIGKGGATSKEIIMKTGWTPHIYRAPTSKSETLKGIRHHLYRYQKERKAILSKIAEKIYSEPRSNNTWSRIVCLGGFREVGRSCILFEKNETKIILDCGINVGSNKEQFPYLDALNFPLDEIDAVVVTHAHMDHAGFVPYLYRNGYDGPVYCTEPTRDLMTLLHFDYIDVVVKEGSDPVYIEQDVKTMLKHCIVREYNEVTDIAPEIRLTLHNAAHILGSASVHLHVGMGEHNLLYTGDIKYGFTRLFDVMDTKYPRLETIIIESTYGDKLDIQPSREVSESTLIKIINETIEKGGNVLIPVFAVGRGQEIMLVIENYYKRGEFKGKCYIDGMTAEANAIFTAYPEYMRESLRRRILQNDSPFTSEIFETVKDNERNDIINNGGSVIIASSGMLTGGPSFEYLKALAEEQKNTLIFVGYQAEGTLGRKIQNGTNIIPVSGKNDKTKALKINMRVETIEGFSGHCDRNQLIAYIKSLKPPAKQIIVNHGEKQKAVNFANFISTRLGIRATALQNLDAKRLS
ncbi:MAG: beta-CASP ribonuclease aCPSF1 [Candidatus Diapherotrites archaeon]|nr:beta-CASP ribonuclease aCPSF1 [Candidatus Diapherotrites archaeon]